MKNKLYIIGISGQELSTTQQELLAHCSLIVGGKRLLQLSQDVPVKTLSITPLDAAFSTIDDTLKQGTVAVLASGDPLFFGIAKRLIAKFGADMVEIHPAISSLQLACARFKTPWDDARIISLHGRNHMHIPGLLLAHHKTFVFTDKKNSPDKLATQIVNYLQSINGLDLLQNIQVMVAENLGASNENIFSGTLKETSSRSFAELNVLCLQIPKDSAGSAFGLHEDEIAHSRGLITKDEIRAVTLHKLRLPQTGIFWDVGAGSGSVSIEAARMNPGLIIYAIERKEKELENIKKNIRTHRCYNIIPVARKAPDNLHNLPDPHRVFIGGNGGQLEGIIEEAAARLPENGLLVANGVIEKTITQAPVFMKAQGLEVHKSSITFSRTDTTGNHTSFNPITIIVGEKFVE